jgi:hypothetical protein
MGMTAALRIRALAGNPAISSLVRLETGGFASPPCGGFALASCVVSPDTNRDATCRVIRTPRIAGRNKRLVRSYDPQQRCVTALLCSGPRASFLQSGFRKARDLHRGLVRNGENRAHVDLAQDVGVLATTCPRCNQCLYELMTKTNNSIPGHKVGMIPTLPGCSVAGIAIYLGGFI